MRILIDECVPRRFLSVFTSYDAVTVPYMGWSGKKNGELLRLMTEADFTVFVTVDQNLQYQQNLQDSPVAILSLHAATNSYDDLLTLVPAIYSTLNDLKPGKIYIIK